MNKPITDSIVSAHRGKALGSIWEVCKDVKQDILQEEDAIVLIREIAEYGLDAPFTPKTPKGARQEWKEWIWCDELNISIGPSIFGGPLTHFGTPDEQGYSRQCNGNHYMIRPDKDNLIDETVYF
jgi:hypothetical protein